MQPRFNVVCARIFSPLALALCLTGFAARATAASAPVHPEIADCWAESGQDLADGEFNVALETAAITKGNLLKILSSLNGVNIEPVGYPLIFDKQVFVTVRGVDQSNPAMSRQNFKATVLDELAKILSISGGTSASCNMISYPAPAVGVSH